MAQSYHLTLEKAIADYEEGYLSTFGLVHYYIKIKFSNGEQIHLETKKVCAELNITKTQFYRAVTKLKEDLPITLISLHE